MEGPQEPEALEQAVRAVRGALKLASDAYQHSAAAHDDLAAAQEEASRREAAGGEERAAGERRRSAKRSSNEAVADRARAKDLADHRRG